MDLTTKEYREYLAFQKDLDNFINEKIIEESDRLEKIKSIEAYREGVSRINGMIDTIKQQSSLAIKSNGGAITVKDCSNARSEDEKYLQIAKEELYRKYLASKKKILSQGNIKK